MADEWVTVRLVPVEVFGADDGYGLCDAVSSWSDCNRAEGFIFRADDIDRVNQGDGQAEVDARCVSVRVLRSDLHKFGPYWQGCSEGSKA